MGEGDGTADGRGKAMTGGGVLRAAREAQGLALAEVAQRTRIPLRHLEAIEDGNFTALPSTTYAMGFGRAYARAVGADETEVARLLRADLAAGYHPREPLQDLEPIDVRRGPSTGLVVAGIAVAVALLVAVAVLVGNAWFTGGDDRAAARNGAVVDLGLATGNGTAPAGGPAAVAVPPPQAAAGGQVTLTATDEVWVRVYDADNTTLLLKTMAAGERYDVPPGANRPMINVGRPDKLTVTVNGSQVPPLGTGRVAIKDVGIGADALLARGETGAGTTPRP